VRDITLASVSKGACALSIPYAFVANRMHMSL